MPTLLREPVRTSLSTRATLWQRFTKTSPRPRATQDVAAAVGDGPSVKKYFDRLRQRKLRAKLSEEAKQAQREKRAAEQRARRAALSEEAKQAQREKKAAAARERRAALRVEPQQAHSALQDQAGQAADGAVASARHKRQREDVEPVAQPACEQLVATQKRQRLQNATNLSEDVKAAEREKRNARERERRAALSEEAKQAQREKSAARARNWYASLSEEAKRARREKSAAADRARRQEPATRAADNAVASARKKRQREDDEPVAQRARALLNEAQKRQRLQNAPAAQTHRVRDAAGHAQARAQPLRAKRRSLRQRQIDAGEPYDNAPAPDCEWCGAKLLHFERYSVGSGKPLTTPCCSNGQV